MLGRLQARLAAIARRFGLRQDWYLVVLGAGIGTITAVGSVGFMALLRLLEHEADALHAGEAWTVWLLPVLPMAGALIAGLLIHLYASEARGHGVPEVMNALYRTGGVIRARVAVVKALASAATIGSGGSAGAEGPIVQIGSAIGSGSAQLLRVSREQTGTLLGCGAAAGIASVFNAPIAGVFFVLEILLRDFSLRTFTPIVVASVFSTAVTQAILGRNDALFAHDLQQYLFTLPELPSYLVMGLICGAVAVGFTRVLYFSEDVFERVRLHPVAKPVLGAGLLGAVGIVFLLLAPGGARHDVPPFFGNGYTAITQLLDPGAYPAASPRPEVDLVEPGLGETVPLSMALVGALVIFKALATCLTLGSGGSGGVFAPSLFLGAATGAAFGLALEAVGLIPAEGSPAAYALVGMAAVVAGTTHAPLTAILIVFEITRDVYVLLPIMLAAVMATLTAQVLLRDSIYTLKLRRRGLLIGTAADMTILRRITADQVPIVPHVAVHPEDPIAKVTDLADRYKVADFVVIDHDGDYLGMLTAEALRAALLQQDAIPLLLVEELMRTDLPTVSPDETLDRVLDKFSRFDVTSLAMVREGQGAVLGLLTRARLMSRYQQALREH
ncbi:MAG: CBS domain-containing protein [Planctomycetota bacterium]|nr:MAG: CBS domain-containing protein [Planctomycetota bacterium]